MLSACGGAGHPPTGPELVSDPTQVRTLTPQSESTARARLAALSPTPPDRVASYQQAPAADAPAGAAITLTVADFPSRGAALAAYNTWFADHGFLAAAERRRLDLGDQAERFDLGWPPLHAVIALRGSRFVLSEAHSSGGDWDGGSDLERAAATGLDLALENG